MGERLTANDPELGRFRDSGGKLILWHGWSDPALTPLASSSPLVLLPDVEIDLDLDATGGSEPTTWFESFENGFGTFTSMQIDADLNPPDDDRGNFEAGVLNADGHRCQYSDPEWVNAASFGNSNGTTCFPAPNGAPDTFFWTITRDRAFSGSQSLYYGFFIDSALGFTTPTAQLERSAFSTTGAPPTPSPGAPPTAGCSTGSWPTTPATSSDPVSALPPTLRIRP